MATTRRPPASRRATRAACTWPRRRCRRARSPGSKRAHAFADRVVGTMWWHVRFPDRDLGNVPRLRPGNGARQAFYREEETGPTITLPRRYRTKGVVLHELAHWALGIDSGPPAPRPHLRPRAARRGGRVLWRRPRRGALGVVPGARRARRRVHRDAVPTAGSTTAGTNGCA